VTMPIDWARAESRFWSKVDFRGDCWEWTAALSGHGYGNFYVGGGAANPIYTKAHRMAWTLLIGPLDPDQHIDHRCRNRRCVNPDHLEPVAAGINVRRGWRMSQVRCKNGHALTPENVRIYVWNGYEGRQCRQCHAQWERERRRRAKEGAA
jgi:HNH endonuclease